MHIGEHWDLLAGGGGGGGVLQARVYVGAGGGSVNFIQTCLTTLPTQHSNPVMGNGTQHMTYLTL